MVDVSNFDIMKGMNTHSHARSAGFTVIELMVIIVILAAASLLFFFQKNNLQTANLDERRKTAINSIYYSLEEVYYPKNGSYPAELTEKNLPAVDPALLTDTNGFKITDKLDETQGASADNKISEYIYEPTNCDMEGKCKSYTLRVDLANEADYIKKSRRS